MRKVVAMGELLIDFIPKQKGVSLLQVKEFVKMPGGAPANVVATVSKLGGQGVFMGQIGRDSFGEYLKSELQKAQVDVSSLYETDEAKTALAFVTLTKQGDRDFVFYRDPSADQLFSPSQVDVEVLKNCIFHFCSVSLSDDPIKDAHLKALKIIKENNGFVSFDPNIRLALWRDHEKYKEVINEFIPYANLVKVAEDELEFITGVFDKKSAVKKLFRGDVEYIIVTKGPKGAELHTKTNFYEEKGFDVEVIDTTGAGDAFIGAILFCLSKKEGEDNVEDELVEYLRFANATAALTTTKLGAMNSIPTIDDVDKLLNKR